MNSFADHVKSFLPERMAIRLRGEADFYGASHAIAKSLGRQKPPKSRTAWQHGWGFEPLDDKRQVIGNHPPSDRILVANQTTANFLIGQGVDAVPVGLPLVYAEQISVPRHAGSLLVMPAHVTKHSEHSVDEAAYVNYIVEQAKDFQQVLICVSQQCADRGFWTDSFAKHGFDFVVGAGIDDRNANARMVALLSQFETVTTNAIGSHLLYAGYCGCRVSLAGPEHVIAESDLTNEPFYQQHPDLIDLVLMRSTHSWFLQQYPHLGSAPGVATTCRPWALETIGQPWRQEPERMAHLLRWGLVDRFKLRTLEVVRKNLPKRCA